MLWFPVKVPVTILVKYRRLIGYKEMLQNHTNLSDSSVAAGGYFAGWWAVKTWKLLVRPCCLEFGKTMLFVNGEITWNLVIFLTGIRSISRKGNWTFFFDSLETRCSLSGPCTSPHHLSSCVRISTGLQLLQSFEFSRGLNVANLTDEYVRRFPCFSSRTSGNTRLMCKNRAIRGLEHSDNPLMPVVRSHVLVPEGLPGPSRPVAGRGTWLRSAPCSPLLSRRVGRGWAQGRKDTVGHVCSVSVPGAVVLLFLKVTDSFCGSELWSVLCEHKLCGSVILKMVIATMLGCENIPYVTRYLYINRVFHLRSIYCYILLSLPWAFKTEMF